MFATSASSLQVISGQLTVLKSRVAVMNIDMATNASAQPLRGNTAVELSPDLVMQAIVAMAPLHHGWREGDVWFLAEGRRIEEELEAITHGKGPVEMSYVKQDREVRHFVP